MTFFTGDKDQNRFVLNLFYAIFALIHVPFPNFFHYDLIFHLFPSSHQPARDYIMLHNLNPQ